jgi:hypothetical protein
MTQTTFVFTTDYKNEFKRYVDELFTYAKVAGRYAGYDLADRAERMALIDELIESYIAATGQRPDSVQLDRLATLCLREELTDTDSHKMRHNEYPIMSDTQLARRKDGVHQRNNGMVYRETGFNKLRDYGADGNIHTKPIRRIRKESEQYEVESRAKSRDPERRKKYNEFIKRQPIKTYKLNEGGNAE